MSKCVEPGLARRVVTEHPPEDEQEVHSRGRSEGGSSGVIGGDTFFLK